MRIACFLVPDLPLQAELRVNPELEDRPLAITSGPGPRADIIAPSRRALARGVRKGQTPPQARAICPELEMRAASPILLRAAREAMLDVALSLAPRAELTRGRSGLFASEAAVYIDATGIEALHGHPRSEKGSLAQTIRASERAFASVLHARAERAGIRGFVALASSRSLARLCARHLAFSRTSPSPSPTSREAPLRTTRILFPEDESDFLSPLPIDLLDPDDRTAQALTRFGLHRIGDLLRLPRRDLATRLGPDLLRLIARTRGEEQDPPLAEPRIDRLEEGIDLEAPIDRLEPLSFVLRGLVSRLAERLTLRSLGCHELRLGLQFENGTQEHRRIGMASPCQDERVLLRLLRRALETRPPRAAIEGVSLLCEGVPLRREQLDLFLPREPDPNELDETLAELDSICGTGRVGAPGIPDDHRPDGFSLRPFPATKRRSASFDGTDSRRIPRDPGLTLRALRPPLRAEVRIERGTPAFLRSAISRGEILHAAGPWRTTGYWWSHSRHFAVDHYDVQMGDGCLLRLCFDWRTKWWQVDGLYD